MCTADACRDVLPAERLQISGQNTRAWTFSRTLQQHNVPHTKKKRKRSGKKTWGAPVLQLTSFSQSGFIFLQCPHQGARNLTSACRRTGGSVGFAECTEVQRKQRSTAVSRSRIILRKKDRDVSKKRWEKETTCCRVLPGQDVQILLNLTLLNLQISLQWRHRRSHR